MQTAEATGSRHLRPDGRECAYLGMPPMCTKCGSDLCPRSSEKERPVSNGEAPGSSPGEGSTSTEVPWQYIVVRRELTGGALLAQVAHAAGESAAGFAVNTGRHLPKDTRVAVLVATKAQLEAIVSENQHRSDLQLWRIDETDGELAGSTTAIAFIVGHKGAAKPIVGHLRVWRPA